MLDICMHHPQKLMEKKRKKIEHILHDCALLVKEFFGFKEIIQLFEA